MKLGDYIDNVDVRSRLYSGEISDEDDIVKQAVDPEIYKLYMQQKKSKKQQEQKCENTTAIESEKIIIKEIDQGIRVWSKNNK